MCGIVGVVCSSKCSKVFGKPLGALIKELLLNLEYRGYDSIGFAVVDEDRRLIVRKSKGKIADVEMKLGFSDYDGSIAIGHTRWATHGEPSDINAHPHTDCSNSIAVVHNGIIYNYEEIKEFLVRKGHTFKSDTDTEVVPHLLEELLLNGYSTVDAVRHLMKTLKGTYALAIISSMDPAKIFFIRNVSPLVIGLREDAIFIASDIPAFLRYTNNVIVLDDGDFGYVSLTEIYVENVFKGSINWRDRVSVIDWTPDMASKEGFPHFMLKEIHEQPIALRNTLTSLGQEVLKATEMIVRADRVLLTGCGTSFHAALVGEYLFNMLCGVDAKAFISSEYVRYRKVLGEKDVVIAISQSGETIDTLMAVREAKKRGARVIAVSNIMSSAIPRESDIAMYTRAGPEIGVAATKTFTSQLLVLLRLSIAVARSLRSEPPEVLEVIENEVKRLPEIVSNVIHVHEPRMRGLAEKLRSKSNAFYLGRGMGIPISMEGALKLKEVAYIHAEAYPAGESKHGPIALVEEGFPVFFTIFDDEFKELIAGNIEEMKSRRALTIGLVFKGCEKAMRSLDIALEMPRLIPYVATVAYTVPYQLIAYYTSVARGLDPDRPRNLAKTVTVE